MAEKKSSAIECYFNIFIKHQMSSYELSKNWTVIKIIKQICKMTEKHENNFTLRVCLGKIFSEVFLKKIKKMRWIFS